MEALSLSRASFLLPIRASVCLSLLCAAASCACVTVADRSACSCCSGKLTAPKPLSSARHAMPAIPTRRTPALIEKNEVPASNGAQSARSTVSSSANVAAAPAAAMIRGSPARLREA
eukprot:6231-Heterococcus_DN1.PRE.1